MSDIGDRIIRACIRTQRVGLILCFFAACSAAAGISACAEQMDETLAPYAVHIHQTPMQSWGPGAGIYLGKNVFITAAHVAGRTWWTRPKVVIDGVAFPTHTIREGSYDGIDLTLLSVEEKLLPMRLRLRRLTLCTMPPVPGQDVVTVVPGAIVHSRILARDALPAALRRFDTVISDVETTGNSGSGVFDPQRRCLMGIMTRKISVPNRDSGNGLRTTRDIAKYFVPAAAIAAFLPPDLHL